MTNKNTIAILALGAIALVQPALAANPRSWVSGKGSDANPCTQDQPCRSFQKAHDVTANGGEVDVLDPADYGPVKVNHAITIDGGSMGYITSDSGQNAVFVDSLGATVALRNLSMLGFSNAPVNAAVWVNAVRNLSVENVSITGFGYGISVQLTPRLPVRVLVKDTTIRDTTAGILTTTGTPAELPYWIMLVADNVTIEGAENGMSLAWTRANVTRSTITNTTNAGVFGNNAELNLSDSTIALCYRGLTVSTNSLFRIAANNIHDNNVAFLNAGGSILSFGNNRVAGNSSGETPTGNLALK